MSQSFIEGFAEARREALKAFNQGDFETAFEDLAPDVQWHLLPSLLETGLLDGRDAVIRYFSRVIEAGTWHVESVEFIDAGGGGVVVHQRGTGTGRTTGIVYTLDFFQIWDVGSDGLVVRVREYERREDALEAAGLQE
jgi:ketosteroid isomerase-like protein